MFSASGLTPGFAGGFARGVRALGLTPRVGGSPSGEEYGIVLHNSYGMCFIGNGQGAANGECLLRERLRA
jgi:hypothetical protein